MCEILKPKLTPGFEKIDFKHVHPKKCASGALPIYSYCGATWPKFITLHFRTWQSVSNAVGTTSISTSGLELRGLKFPFFRKFDPLLQKNSVLGKPHFQCIGRGYHCLLSLKLSRIQLLQVWRKLASKLSKSRLDLDYFRATKSHSLRGKCHLE